VKTIHSETGNGDQDLLKLELTGTTTWSHHLLEQLQEEGWELDFA